MWKKKKNTKLPFKAANPFFLPLKSLSLPLSLSLSLSGSIFSAKSSRACCLSWEDGNQTGGDRNEGEKGRDRGRDSEGCI